jgi:hypothetical protein
MLLHSSDMNIIDCTRMVLKVNTLKSDYLEPTHRIIKLSKLPLPSYCINWLIAFLSGRTHTNENKLNESSALSKNHNIIQVVVYDFKSNSQFDIIFKYADDTQLISSSIH